MVEPLGARSTFTGSLRQIASELGISPSQVRRDLILAELRNLGEEELDWDYPHARVGAWPNSA